MFYTQFIAYDRLMNFEEYLELKNKKISCAVIDNGKLPQFLAEDPLILKVKAPDNSWEEIN